MPLGLPCPAMRVVHLGDLHHYRLWANPLACFNKRLLGLGNLWLNRRRRFRRELWPAIARRIVSLRPDWVLCSGDLTTTSLPGEFEDVARLLAPVTESCPTLLIPGNHDRYVPGAAGMMERSLGRWMPPAYPHLAPLNEHWSVLCLDAAFPQWHAQGRVGEAQLARATELVRGLEAGRGLVVLCHYTASTPPPEVHEPPRHGLIDAAEVRALMREAAAAARAVVYLHGHIHRPWCCCAEEAGLDRMLDLNAGAPCMRSTLFPEGQGFWELDLPSPPAMPRCRHHVPDALGDDGWSVAMHNPFAGA